MAYLHGDEFTFLRIMEEDGIMDVSREISLKMPGKNIYIYACWIRGFVAWLGVREAQVKLIEGRCEEANGRS